MNKFLKSAVAGVLSVTMLTALLPRVLAVSPDGESEIPAGALATLVERNGTGTSDPLYVSDMITASGATRAEAEGKLRSAGYTVVDGNLNEGAGGYVCLGYKFTDKREDAITGVKMMTMNGGYDQWDYREFLRSNTDGLPAVVAGMTASCKKMKALLDSGDAAAAVAYKTLNVLCVPETTKTRKGTPLGTYLLAPERTYEDYETIILVVQSSMLTFINDQLAVGCSNCYDNQETGSMTGWISDPDWLYNAVETMKATASAVSAKGETAEDELTAAHAMDAAALTDPQNFADVINKTDEEYLKGVPVGLAYKGVTYSNAYELLTGAPAYLLACFAEALPASIPAAAFGTVLTAFVADPQSRVPGDVPALPEVVSPLMASAVDYLNNTSANPFTPEGRAEILEAHGDLDEEIGFFLTLVKEFIKEYRNQKADYVAMLDDVDRDLTFQESMAEYTRRVEEYNKSRDETEQLKSDMLFYIGPYEALRQYRFVERDFLRAPGAAGTTVPVTDLAAYFELICDTNEKDPETAKALACAVLGGFSEADRYLVKTAGMPLFLMDTCISPSHTQEIESQYEDSKQMLTEAYAELGYAEDECSVWVGTNKDMLETEFLARTDATIRACEEEKEFSDQLMQAQADKHALDGLTNALEYSGIAMAAVFVVLSVATWVLSKSVGTIVGMTMMIKMGLFTMAGGGSAWGLGMAGMIAAVAGIFAIVLIALLIVAFIVLLILLFTADKGKKEDDVERTSIPTIMMDCALDLNNRTKYATRYDVVRDVEGKAADINNEKCTYWNALYYTKSDKGGSPLMCNAEGEFFSVTVNTSKTPAYGMTVSGFANNNAYDFNTRADTDTAVYLHYYSYDSLNEVVPKSQGSGKYIESLVMAVATRESLARSALLRKSSEVTILDVDLTPHTDYYTFLGFTTTNDPKKAVTDIRASAGTTSFSMQWGDSGIKYISVYDNSEVSCPIKTVGSEEAAGDDTYFVYQLYTCKSTAVGDPILTESLRVVNKLSDVPAGYEYARWFSGGAFDFSAEARNKAYFTDHHFLIFAPEEQYRVYQSDVEYLAGFGFFSGSTAWLGDSAANLAHSAEDMGYHLIDVDLTPNALNDEADKTFMGYATTINPKKAITDVGVFTGESDTNGMLSDTIVRAGEFFASCVVFQSGDKGYLDEGAAKVRSIRATHAYVTSNDDEAYTCEMKGWEDYAVRPRAMYVCGPRTGIEPIHVSDVAYALDPYSLPSASGSKGTLTTLGGGKLSNAGTGWKSVHALDQYFHDAYDENGDLTTFGSNLGVLRPNGADANMYLYFKNNTPDIVRGKYIKSVELVGSDSEDGAFDSARLQAMGAGEEIVNLSAPLFSDPADRWDMSDDTIIYRKNDKRFSGYADSCTLLVVSYQEESAGSVSMVYIAHQNGENEQPTVMDHVNHLGKTESLTKGKYLAPDPLKRGEKNKNDGDIKKGYAVYTCTTGDHLGRISVMENGKPMMDSMGMDYRLMETVDGEIFSARGDYEQSVALYIGSVGAYISDIAITEESTLASARQDLMQKGYSQFIVTDLMAGNSAKRYHLGIARTGTAKKAIKDIRIANALLPTEKDSSGKELLVDGEPYTMIEGRAYTLVNAESLTAKVEGSKVPVYIYVTRGNATEQGKTKGLTAYPERVAVTNIGLQYTLEEGKRKEIYWNGMSEDYPHDTLPPSMDASTMILTVGGIEQDRSGELQFSDDAELTGDAYSAAERYRSQSGNSADWTSRHGKARMLYTTGSGYSMLEYEMGFEMGIFTGSKKGDDAANIDPNAAVGSIFSTTGGIVAVVVLGLGLAAVAFVFLRARRQRKRQPQNDQ